MPSFNTFAVLSRTKPRLQVIVRGNWSVIRKWAIGLLFIIRERNSNASSERLTTEQMLEKNQVPRAGIEPTSHPWLVHDNYRGNYSGMGWIWILITKHFPRDLRQSGNSILLLIVKQLVYRNRCKSLVNVNVINMRLISKNLFIIREKLWCVLEEWFFSAFVLLLFPLRHIRVSPSDDGQSVRNVWYVLKLQLGSSIFDLPQSFSLLVVRDLC